MNESQPYGDGEGFAALGENPGESIAQILRIELGSSALDQSGTTSPPIKVPSRRVANGKAASKVRVRKVLPPVSPTVHPLPV